MKESPQQAASSWIPPTVVLLITAAVFIPSLNFGFVCDDTSQILMNQARFTWRSIPSYFKTDVWSYITFFKTNYYRPVFLSWLMLNYQLFGVDAVLWHLSAVLAHLSATFLLYRLALRLLGGRFAAAGAALVFGVHPVHAEAVSWVSGSTETIFAAFGLASLLSHINWRDPAASQHRRAWRAAELGLFALALFTKETAIVLPALAFAWEWIFPIADVTERAKRRVTVALASVVPYFYIVLFYAVARFHALGALVPLPRDWTLPMLLATWPMVIAHYLRQLAVPMEYSMFYPFAAVKHFGAQEFVRYLLPVMLVAGALIWASLRSRVAAFCSLLLLLPVLPVLNLRAFAFDDFVHDRYLYLPSAGFCILVAFGLEKLAREWRVRAAMVLAAVIFLSAVTVRTSRYWNDNLSLYTHAVEVAPESAIAAEYLGEELVERERWADALPILNRALLQDPTAYDMYVRIAKCYLGLGDTSEAVAYFNDAITLFPNVPNAYFDLASVEYKGNQLQEAEHHMRQAMELRPGYSPLFDEYHLRMGQILEGEQKWDEALAEYRAEVAESPSNENAVEALDRLVKKRGVSAP